MPWWQRAQRSLSNERIDIYDIALVGMTVGLVADLATGQGVGLVERLLSPVMVFFVFCIAATALGKIAKKRKRPIERGRDHRRRG